MAQQHIIPITFTGLSIIVIMRRIPSIIIAQFGVENKRQPIETGCLFCANGQINRKRNGKI